MDGNKDDAIRMVTKYEQIEQLIKNRIRNGEYKPGDRISSEYELADELGVHRFTVNKAISNLVRTELLYRVQGKGTFVSIPREREASNCIGVVYGGPREALFQTGFGAAVMQGIYDGAERNIMFFDTDIVSTTRGPELSDAELDKVDGVLAFEIFNDEYIERLAARKPLVSVDYWAEGQKAPAVIFDNIGATKKAARNLLSLGHRRIACVSEDPGRVYTDPAWQDRTRGWREAMEEAGLTTDGLFEGLPARSGDLGVGAAENILKWDVPPTAVMVMSDHAAAHLMKVVAAHGVRVPEDMSVVGFGDEDVCKVVTPGLSSIGLDVNEMGVKAAKLLERTIHGQVPAGEVEKVETYYVERESVGPPPKK
ncbi:MAG: GntR family transcriptional regulator [Planctomycetes bacterium]|nr:GntR family transcriptional regulator [Planctomycetota bacterium]